MVFTPKSRCIEAGRAETTVSDDNWRLDELVCRLTLLLFVLTAITTWAVESRADDQSKNGTKALAWEFAVSPYLWAAGLEGETGTLPGLPPADVDESFSDILDDLEFAGMVTGAAKKGRYGFSGDLQYVETTAKDNSLAPLFRREEVTSKSLIVSAMGDYFVAEDGRSNLILSAGARVWSVETNLKLSSGVLAGRTIKGDDTWVDPVVGARGSLELGSAAFLVGWGFIGGFGIGSEIMADLFGGVGYRFSETTSATVGYRWMKVNRDEDGFLYNVVQKGILAGLTIEF